MLTPILADPFIEWKAITHDGDSPEPFTTMRAAKDWVTENVPPHLWSSVTYQRIEITTYKESAS